jgi:hypothetical protein
MVNLVVQSKCYSCVDTYTTFAAIASMLWIAVPVMITISMYDDAT